MGGMDFSQLYQPVQYPERRDTGYEDYFNNYVNRYAPQGQDYFFNMEDPEVKAYQEAAARPPESKSFIEEYLSRRPQLEDYQPSLGRKLGAFALGTLSGLRDPRMALENASRVRMDPFVSQMQDWQGEGANITARAKSLDDAQNRALSAQKFGLVERAKAAREAELAKNRTLTGGTRYAGSVVTGQNAQDRNDAQRAQFDSSQLLKTAIAALAESHRNQADEDRARALDLRERAIADAEARGTRPTGYEQRLNDPSEILKQQEAAFSLAMKELTSRPELNPNGVYNPIIEAMREAVNNKQDPRIGIDEADVAEPIRRIFRSHLESIIKKYMAGR